MNDKTFYLKGGKKLSSIKAFASELKSMSLEAYRHHVNSQKNDFANWIKHSILDDKLASKIEGQIDKVEMELEVLRHLVHAGNGIKEIIQKEAEKDNKVEKPKTKKKVIIKKKTNTTNKKSTSKKKTNKKSEK